MARGEVPPPAWLPPMLATLGEEATTPAAWPAEPKWDGVRVLAVLRPDGLRLLSRNETEFTRTFPEIAEELAGRARGYGIVDGEVVAGAPGTLGDFARLQRRLGREAGAHAAGVRVAFHVFDVLWWEGRDVRPLPWTERRAMLGETLEFGGLVRETPVWRGRRAARLAAMCRRGGEGLIVKRPDAAYQGARSRDWVKLKCARVGEFTVGGWTAPSGMRRGIGALLVGAWDGGVLRYAGRVGTGFSDDELARTAERLVGLERSSSPFVNTPRHAARWCEPVLRCRVRFLEWTGEGRLRHPAFVGW